MGIVNLSQAPADLADENECELLSSLPVLFGFVNQSELHCETRDLYDKDPTVFGRMLSGRDVQTDKNQRKLTVHCGRFAGGNVHHVQHRPKLRPTEYSPI